MKDFFKFIGIVIGGSALVISAMVGYTFLPDRDSGSAPSAVQPRAGTDSQGVFGPHRYFYTKQDGIVAATFTPFLPRNDATVIGAIRSVVRSAYGANINAVSPVLAGQEIAFASPTTTYYVTLVKQTSGEVHSLTIRASQ
jgi:hypothetical protein